MAGSQVKKQLVALWSQQAPRYCPRKEVSPSMLTIQLQPRICPFLLRCFLLSTDVTTWEPALVNDTWMCDLGNMHGGFWREPVGMFWQSGQGVFLSIWTRHLCCASCCRVWLFAIPWTVAGQAPLSVEFSRQKSWSCHSLLHWMRWVVFKMMCARAPGLGADGVICSALWASDYFFILKQVFQSWNGGREGGRRKREKTLKAGLIFQCPHG